MTQVSNLAPEPAPQSRFGYIPGLDGMRGLWVVLGPLLYHARPDGIPGGILALDLFFVLSSYLITAIALNEWDRTGRIDLLAYAGRRARRLAPALLLCLAALTAYLVVAGEPDQYARWTGAIVATLTYSANWYEAFSGISYFEQYANPSPLVHVWSFAVEEQFYLFAPFFLIACLKLFKRHAGVVICVLSVVGAVASAMWMARLYTGGDPSRVYYGTDTRAMALFVGILLAAGTRWYGPPRTRTGRNLIVAGAYGASAFYAFAVLTISEKSEWMFERGGFLLMAVAAALIVLGVTQPSRGPLHRFYESGPVRWTGRISYGLYLYHWPIYLLVITPERLADSLGWVAAGLALTFAAAAVSHHFVELPVVHRRFPIVRRPLQPWPAAFASVVAVVAILGGLLAVNANQPEVVRQVLVAPAGESLPRPNGGTTVIGGSGELRVMLIGDSVSWQIGEALQAWAQRNPGRLVVFNHAHLGCIVARYGEKRVPEGDVGPVGDVCSAWNDPVPVERLDGSPRVISWPTAVQAFRPDVVIGHITPWDVTDRRVPQLGDHWTHIGQPDFDEYARAEYRLATEVLTATGSRMVWLLGAHLNRAPTPQNDPARVDRLNDLVAEAVADLPRAGFADFPAFIGAVGSARERAIRHDGVHLSKQGLDEVDDWVVREILGLE
jgi:peptidoglycan/LPS O-acetylase OafA/YrhL